MSEVIDVSPEFIEESKLGQTGSNPRKGGRYSKKNRHERRDQVYKLHFDQGYSGRQISEIMKLNKNTIADDLKYLYSKLPNILEEYGFDSMISKHIQRLESQRTRLLQSLDKEDDWNMKLAIERLIMELDQKLTNITFRVGDSEYKQNIFAIQVANDHLRKEKADKLLFSPWETILISKAKRQEIYKILNQEFPE